MSDEKKLRPMAEEQRAEIRERCDKATPPPWVASEYASGVDLGYKPDHERTWGYGCGNSIVCDLNDGEYHNYCNEAEQRANAEFIAHSREDIPALLADVERLRAENQRLERAANWLADILEEYTDCCPLRFALENCETSRIPKVDGCEGTWPVGDYFHCLVRRENKKCWVEAAVKATSEGGTMSDRSEQALRERLELTSKATRGPWKIFRECGKEPRVGIATKETLDDFDAGELVIVVDYDNDSSGILREADAAHIAASSPDVVCADLEEILALRAEVARLKDEVASLEQELKFSDETEYELIKKLFDLKICHKETICEQADAQELNFEGESGCLFCWRQWAIRKARKAASEEE